MYNDADLEMAGLEAIGNTMAAMRKAGVCSHSGVVGPIGAAQTGYTVPVGCAVMCPSCGQGFTNADVWLEIRDEIMGEWS